MAVLSGRSQCELQTLCICNPWKVVNMIQHSVVLWGVTQGGIKLRWLWFRSSWWVMFWLSPVPLIKRITWAALKIKHALLKCGKINLGGLALCRVYSASNLCGTFLVRIEGVWGFNCRSSEFYFLYEPVTSDSTICCPTEHEIVNKCFCASRGTAAKTTCSK